MYPARLHASLLIGAVATACISPVVARVPALSIQFTEAWPAVADRVPYGISDVSRLSLFNMSIESGLPSIFSKSYTMLVETGVSTDLSTSAMAV